LIHELAGTEIDMSSSQRLGTALVTGASSGIGAIYADRLAKRGYDLILVARDRSRLEEVAKRIRDDSGRTVTSITADLNKKIDLLKVEEVLRTDDRITLLVNNAGIGAVASILEADVDKMEAMIGLNINALTRLTYAVAPAFARRRAGTIINIASVVAIAIEALNGVYSASKAFVIAFGHSLQHDLAEKGVRVQTVLPGATSTGFWDVAGNSGKKREAATMTPENCVDAALAGLDLGEQVTIPSLHDSEAWNRWETDRRILSGKLENAEPAARYNITTRAAA
jgi:short-subunit dehydrogenase